MSDERTPVGAGGETQKIEPPAEPSPPAAAASPWEASRGRRIGVRSLIVVATLIGIVSVYATWARTQLLDTPQWKRTSTQLLEDKEIRTQVSSYLVDQLYANVDVEKEIGDQLPKTLKALAPAAAAGLRQLVDQVADKALNRPIVQTSWANANEIAHRQFVKVVDGGGKNLSTTGGVVTLNLQPVLTQIASRLGIPDSLIQQIPPQAASVEILRSSELKQAQDAVKLLRTLAIVLAFLVVLLFTLAVWLAAGHRRQTLMAVGFGFITAGFVVLIIRGIAGHEVTNSLVTTASVRPAVENAWAIGTSLLQTLGVQAMIIGLGVVAAAWVAGPARPAVAIRRASAPVLRERPEVAYSLLAAVLLLFLAWAPIPAARRPLFIVCLIVFSFLGLYVLRRSTAREFPDALSGDTTSGLMDRARRAGSDAQQFASGAVASVRARSAQADETMPAGDADEQRYAKLERLAALRDGGALSDEEFAAEKAKLLGE